MTAKGGPLGGGVETARLGPGNVGAMKIYFVWWMRSLPGEYLKLTA